MKLTLLLTVILLSPVLIKAQDKSTVQLTRRRLNDTLVVAQRDTSAQKDLYDVIRSIFNKKGAVDNKATTFWSQLVSAS